MPAPHAVTKKTRSNWSKKAQQNKNVELTRSQKVTVMSRFGSSSLSKFMSEYMSRDGAAIGSELEPLNQDAFEMYKSHMQDMTLNAELEIEDLTKIDVSGESLGYVRSSRLFDGTHQGLTDELVLDKMSKFKTAQQAGHTPIIQVVSFDLDYLKEQKIVPENMSDLTEETKGQFAQEVDLAKLKTGIQSAIKQMSNQAGFSKLEYVAALHGNTQHMHAHIAMIETDDDAQERLVNRDVLEDDSALQDINNDNQTIIGHTHAAQKLEQQLKLPEGQHIVERGMMRQSELDYFRQELDDTLTGLSDLEYVNDYDRQQAYVATINQRSLKKLKQNDRFLDDFVKTYDTLKQPVPQQHLTNITPALNQQLDHLSFSLVDGLDLGQDRFMSETYKIATRNAKLKGSKAYLDEIQSNHDEHHPRFLDMVKDFTDDHLQETDGFKTGALLAVKAPSEINAFGQLSDSNQRIYRQRYLTFANEPTVQNMEGLVVADQVAYQKHVDDDRNERLVKAQNLLKLQLKKTTLDLIKTGLDQNISTQDMTLAFQEAIPRVTKNRNQQSLKRLKLDTALDTDEPIWGQNLSSNSQERIKRFNQALIKVSQRKAGYQPVQDVLSMKVAAIADAPESLVKLPKNAPQTLLDSSQLINHQWRRENEDVQQLLVGHPIETYHGDVDNLNQKAYDDAFKPSENLKQIVFANAPVSDVRHHLAEAMYHEIKVKGSPERLMAEDQSSQVELIAKYRQTQFKQMDQLESQTLLLQNEDVNDKWSDAKKDMISIMTDMHFVHEERLDLMNSIANVSKLPARQQKGVYQKLALIYQNDEHDDDVTSHRLSMPGFQKRVHKKDTPADILYQHLNDTSTRLDDMSDQLALQADTLLQLRQVDDLKNEKEYVETLINHKATQQVADKVNGVNFELPITQNVACDIASGQLEIDGKVVLNEDEAKSLRQKLQLDQPTDVALALDDLSLDHDEEDVSAMTPMINNQMVQESDYALAPDLMAQDDDLIENIERDYVKLYNDDDLIENMQSIQSLDVNELQEMNAHLQELYDRQSMDIKPRAHHLQQDNVARDAELAILQEQNDKGMDLDEI